MAGPVPLPPVQIPRTLVNQILAHAQQCPDEEVCGLIGRAPSGEPRPYRVANRAAEPRRLFEMDAKGQIDALRAMRERGEDLFAIYHSHPDAPPEPSAADIAQAAYPEALYLIVSLNTEGVLEMRGFRLEKKRFAPVELEVV